MNGAGSRYSAGLLAEWTPAIRSANGRTRPTEPQAPYDGWFGESDSVLLALAQEVGLKEDGPAVGHYLALRLAPSEAPLAAAAIRDAGTRRLTVHGARTVALACVSAAGQDPWAVKFRFSSPQLWATHFASQVQRVGPDVLAVVFAGPADFSEGCVTWAGVLPLD